MTRYPGGSLRERKRNSTMQEIKAVALTQLADGGAMTLRGVAREVGMTVQSLYHYFPSRDELITALITDAHDALADAVEQSRRTPGGDGLVPLTLAYRAWSVEHRAQFLLIYGTPIPGYRAPEAGPTTVAARRLGAAFAAGVFGHWTAAEIGRLQPPAGHDGVTAALAEGAALVAPALPPAVFGLFIELWGRMHGLVMLEVLNHVPWLQPTEVASSYFEAAMTRTAAELDRIRRAGR